MLKALFKLLQRLHVNFFVSLIEVKNGHEGGGRSGGAKCNKVLRPSPSWPFIAEVIFHHFNSQLRKIFFKWRHVKVP